MTTICSRVDLHIHTTASDGSLPPQALVARAAIQGIQVLAITDHDTTAGVPAALEEACRHDVVVVPGVEISALAGREELHLLGYFVDLENADLQSLLARNRAARRERAEKMLVRLAQLGLPLDWQHLVDMAGEEASIGRPHVATSLLQAGHVATWDEAFDRWIGRDCPAYVERFKLSPEEAIDMIRHSGGLPILAHPYVYNRRGERKKEMDLKHWLPRLCEAGLAGIEVYYPNYPRRVSRYLLEMALKHALLITGGSDFHGGMAANGLGGVDVPWAAWEGLQRRYRNASVAVASI